MTDALPCHIHLPVYLWIMDPHSRAAKKNTSHGNEMLPQDTLHLIQRPCYQRGSSCQDPTGNRTTQRPDHHKETQTGGMDMSPIHQVWPKPSCKAQWKGEEDKADRRRGVKTTWFTSIQEDGCDKGAHQLYPVNPNWFPPCQCCCYLCYPGEYIGLGTLISYNWAQVLEACDCLKNFCPCILISVLMPLVLSSNCAYSFWLLSA